MTDVMYVLNDYQIIQNVQHMNRSARYITLLMEDDMEFPGFSRLKLITEIDRQYIFTSHTCYVETTNGIYFSNISFIRQLIEGCVNYKHSYMVLACLTKKRPWIWLSAFTFIPGHNKQKHGYFVIDMVSGRRIH
jgi:hypothetical protein